MFSTVMPGLILEVTTFQGVMRVTKERCGRTKFSLIFVSFFEMSFQFQLSFFNFCFFLWTGKKNRITSQLLFQRHFSDLSFLCFFALTFSYVITTCFVVLWCRNRLFFLTTPVFRHHSPGQVPSEKFTPIICVVCLCVERLGSLPVHKHVCKFSHKCLLLHPRSARVRYGF